MFNRLPALTLGALLAALLVGCGSGTRAPVVDLSLGSPPRTPAVTPALTPPLTPPAPPPAGQRAAETHIVKPGDTLYSIARTTGASLDALIRANDIGDPDVLQVGQVLKLSADGARPAPTAPVTPPVTATVMPPVVTQPTVTQPTITPPPARTPPPPRAADATLNNWGWPARGELIQAFSPATKGIDIAGRTGDPVHAAADGKVAYVGNGVRGLGNLILIEHAGGFLSAYAHNQRMFVTKDQAVKRGAKIAEVGQTDTSSPRLHFEVRREGTPVNPLHYLPPR